MPWHPSLNQLRDALAELYPDVADARVVAASALLPLGTVVLQGKARTVWQSILEEADKRNCVKAVIAAASADYGQNPTLLAAVEAYHQGIGKEKSPAPVPTVSVAESPQSTTSTLSVMRTQNGYFVVLDMPQRGPIQEYVEFSNTERDARLADFKFHMQMAESALLLRHGLASGEVDVSVPSTNRLAEIGRSLYSLFMPAPIKRAWGNLSGPLEIRTNDETLPWELIHDGHGFLSLRHPLARSLSGEDAPTPPLSAAKPVSDLRFLLVSADPYNDLDTVHPETDCLSKELSQMGVRSEYLGRSHAVWNVIQAKLRQRSYDVVHFAGHVVFDRQIADKCGLVLEDGDLFSLAQIKLAINGHPLVFVNGCYWDSPSAGDVRRMTSEDVPMLASAFLQGGARGFIGSRWSVGDELSYQFALQFYRRCLAGETIAEALRATRATLQPGDGNGFTWPAFVYFGDPTDQLAMPGRS